MLATKHVSMEESEHNLTTREEEQLLNISISYPALTLPPAPPGKGAVR